MRNTLKDIGMGWISQEDKSDPKHLRTVKKYLFWIMPHKMLLLCVLLKVTGKWSRWPWPVWIQKVVWRIDSSQTSGHLLVTNFTVLLHSSTLSYMYLGICVFVFPVLTYLCLRVFCVNVFVFLKGVCVTSLYKIRLGWPVGELVGALVGWLDAN